MRPEADKVPTQRAASLARRDLDVTLLRVPEHCRLYRTARRRLFDEAPELAHAAHPLAVEVDDHVGALHARLLGRAVGPHFLDNHAGAVAVGDVDADLRTAAGEDHEVGRRLPAPLRVRRDLGGGADANGRRQGACDHRVLHCRSPAAVSMRLSDESPRPKVV